MDFILALLTTIGFQITSNFANDYGDGVKGTDNEDRIGPARVLQSGLLSRGTLKRGIFISIGITFAVAVVLLYRAFGTDYILLFGIFLLLGALSIWAAVRYTVGTNPYGYMGLGDLFVFLFFGLLGVLGSMFLYTKVIHWNAILPAVSIGLLCVGVLNLNNLRDVHSDKKSGKNTLVVKMGFAMGKWYHFVLIIVALLSFLAYILLEKTELADTYYLLAFVPIIIHLVKVMKTKDPKNLDGELKKLALSTFLLSILYCIAVNNFL